MYFILLGMQGRCASQHVTPINHLVVKASTTTSYRGPPIRFPKPKFLRRYGTAQINVLIFLKPVSHILSHPPSSFQHSQHVPHPLTTPPNPRSKLSHEKKKASNNPALKLTCQRSRNKRLQAFLNLPPNDSPLAMNRNLVYVATRATAQIVFVSREPITSSALPKPSIKRCTCCTGVFERHAFQGIGCRVAGGGDESEARGDGLRHSGSLRVGMRGRGGHPVVVGMASFMTVHEMACVGKSRSKILFPQVRLDVVRGCWR